MKEIYSDFAQVYDRLQDIDYNTFVEYYKRLFAAFGCKPELVLDLGCGTGNITIPLAECGFDMIGVDISEEMLYIASEKARAAQLDKRILFLNQDMTEFELYGTVDAAVCALDGANYLTEDGDLDRLFSLMHNYLNPNGLFIFDINTRHKLCDILGDNTYTYDNDGAYCIWNSFFDGNDNICEFDLDFFVRQPSGLYMRGEEVQFERAYSDFEIRKAAESAGLHVLAAFDDRTQNAATAESERVFYVIQR